jgi:hypothetical protein
MPRLFRNELLAADGLDEQRLARPGEVKRLGEQPTVIRLRTGTATVEVATRGEDVKLLLDPYRQALTRSASSGDSRLAEPGDGASAR